MISYWGLDWKTGAARRLQPLRRDASFFSWLFKAHAKFGSSKHTPLLFGKIIGSSSNSNNRLGLAARAGVALLLRFPFPGLRGDVVVLLRGWSRAGTDTDMCSTCPTSTTLDIRTPAQQDGSPTSDDSTLRTPNHLSDVTRASFCLTTAASHGFLRSTEVAS